MYERMYRYVQTISKSGNIATAAKELYITPSALSKALQKLEADYGITLFDRVGKRFVLTYAGEQYLQDAQHILDMQEQLDRKMRRIASLDAGLLRIGVSNRVIPKLLPTLSAFHHTYPGITIHLLDVGNTALDKWLENGEIDLLISDYREKIHANWNTRFLAKSEVVLVTSRTSPLLKKSVWQSERKYPFLPLTECNGESFVTPFFDYPLGSSLLKLLEESGIEYHIAAHASTANTLYQMAAAGLGIAITYDTPLESFEHTHNLAALSFLPLDSELNRSLILATPPHHSLSRAAQKFIPFCLNHFSQTQPPADP